MVDPPVPVHSSGGTDHGGVPFGDAARLVAADPPEITQAERLLASVGFADSQLALERLREMCVDDACRQALADCLPMLLVSLSEAATPDGSLLNFERYVQSVSNRAGLFRYLASNPRAVEILVKLFVGSQFLTEILLRNPDYLERLTIHKRVAEFKSREDFAEDAREQALAQSHLPDQLNALRRFQRWELLRIGACDTFGLFDLKSVTVQLSLLADSLIQTCLALISDKLQVPVDEFAVLALGKLGGEELNYSSDIDLVFVSDRDATRFWTLGQRLIKALLESTSEGFLYRVDMRLRPWGRSGSLVNSIEAHVSYLKQHGMPWEKQALLKARVVAGNTRVGQLFLDRVAPLIYSLPVDEIRTNIRDMKSRIEADLKRQGRDWGEVKSGAGSIRDVEFVTQSLQLVHGKDHPEVRSINTLDALVRLADFGFLNADEFRHLSSGYVFLRTIEHSLQLMHHKQTHALPADRRELTYLARRLDFHDADQFLAHYERHCEAIRAIYQTHVGGDPPPDDGGGGPAGRPAFPDHLAHMEPSYAETFDAAAIARHAEMLKKLSDDNIVELETEDLADGRSRVTIVGFNDLGNLSMICGLLFVYGFDICDGNAFTAEQVAAEHTARSRKRAAGSAGQRKGRASRKRGSGRIVDVFTVRPPLDVVLPEVWIRYKEDLKSLLGLIHEGRQREAHGELAKRVAGALRSVPDDEETLYPVEIGIDNDASPESTVLNIRAADTIGFLYELTNALALAGVDMQRVIVSSEGRRVFDTLYVTDGQGQRITDPSRLRELRAAVVLIKHFTHLLPRSPNPEAALMHFRDFLEQLFQQPKWLDELSSLERSDVLDALARLLGVSDFLWEDFLRLQHANLFPVVKDVEKLAQRRSYDSLLSDIKAELATSADAEDRRDKLNAFKDREMFRADLRHIMGHVTQFGEFSDELTDVADVVVSAGYEICDTELSARYGRPLLADGRPCPLSVCALGKCGGRELGFASDIELMFIYEANGDTAGPDVMTVAEYYQKLVEAFTQSIRARREGIFQIDLRLRPYGKAGSLAVSLDAFQNYFAPDGAAWPYERQALVKLRPVAADARFGRRILELRDRLIYTGEPFDVAAMRAMREKQVRQLVKAGTLNAKLSPGGLVDCEYLVQGLQITFGHREPALRTTNTLAATDALRQSGILSAEHARQLREAYIFQRRLIDALRMVRGHARDLTVPEPESEEFEFLARRLGYAADLVRLRDDLEQSFQTVQELARLLDRPPEDVSSS